jgi:1,4-dihydroxy-2-naphthoate polyprenyltransferase
MKKLNLSLRVLNELIEFRTSIGIITSVLIGTGYAFYKHRALDIPLLFSMLLASILLDGAATVFNHFFDFKKAKTKEGYLYNVHNPIVAYGLHPYVAFGVGTILVGIAGLLGLYIVYMTHWILIPVGAVSVMIAYFYSAGKYPISYSPYGELVSGIFEGTIVFGIAYFIQSLDFSLNIVLISLPIALGISNIMLANNTSDVDEDLKNGRKTLPIVIGQDKGVKLLYVTHFTMFALNTVYFIAGRMPWTIFISYLLIPQAIKNLKTFNENRTKAKGFVFVLKNTILFNLMEIIALWAAAII